MFQLFYQTPDQRNIEVEQHLSADGRHVEVFYVDMHRDSYDHTELDPRAKGDPRWNGCFCNWPDPVDTKWPKLFDNANFVASGHDDLLALNVLAIPDIPLLTPTDN